MFVCWYLFTEIVTALPNRIKLRPSAKRSSYISVVVVVEHLTTIQTPSWDNFVMKRKYKGNQVAEITRGNIIITTQAANRSSFHNWVAKITNINYLKKPKTMTGKFGHRECREISEIFLWENIFIKISRSLYIYNVGQSFVFVFLTDFISIAIIWTTIIRLYFTAIDGYEAGREKKGGQGVERCI